MLLEPGAPWGLPRVCGGTTVMLLEPGAPWGLSPRVRGNPAEHRGDGLGVGSIPACAGEPGWRPSSSNQCPVYPRVCGGTEPCQGSTLPWRGLSPRVRGNHRQTLAPTRSTRSIPACAGEPCRRANWPCPLPLDGLSPRVRGNRVVSQDEVVQGGSIPACAGEPPWRSPWHCWRRVYPRVCGGTLRAPGQLRRPHGLSPRVRGNPLPGPRRKAGRRSIPACAGEPSLPRTPRHRRRVYPRVCGGTCHAAACLLRYPGLSPRVRGNLVLCHGASGLTWSIPACAGEPHRAGADSDLSEVYPRVCGGTRARDEQLASRGGLSPRVRGNRLEHEGDGQAMRSIPACAGEPRPHELRRRRSGVYPRVCGGTGCRGPCSLSSPGLSPRVRGNLFCVHFPAPKRRSIPACAGEPLRRRQPWPRRRVYPRVCGGTARIAESWTPPSPLSPRVRGNRWEDRATQGPRRSIPACAGEP